MADSQSVMISVDTKEVAVLKEAFKHFAVGIGLFVRQKCEHYRYNVTANFTMNRVQLSEKTRHALESAIH